MLSEKNIRNYVGTIILLEYIINTEKYMIPSFVDPIISTNIKEKYLILPFNNSHSFFTFIRQIDLSINNSFYLSENFEMRKMEELTSSQLLILFQQYPKFYFGEDIHKIQEEKICNDILLNIIFILI